MPFESLMASAESKRKTAPMGGNSKRHLGAVIPSVLFRQKLASAN
jgi:hypothetical protein